MTDSGAFLQYLIIELYSYTNLLQNTITNRHSNTKLRSFMIKFFAKIERLEHRVILIDDMLHIVPVSSFVRVTPKRKEKMLLLLSEAQNKKTEIIQFIHTTADQFLRRVKELGGAIELSEGSFKVDVSVHALDELRSMLPICAPQVFTLLGGDSNSFRYAVVFNKEQHIQDLKEQEERLAKLEAKILDIEAKSLKRLASGNNINDNYSQNNI